MKLIMKNIFKIHMLLIFILFTSQNIAATVSDAVQASENNDAAEAVKLWSQLADEGNLIAKFNLANHYSSGNGVKKNELLAEQWLKDAARSGLIEAYLNLNDQAIAPAKGQRLSFQVGPTIWLKKQEPNKYTIQLASSRYEKSILKSYEKNNLKGKGGYYHYLRDGVDRYALVYGAYKTVAAANAAMKTLPNELRKKTPWVRKIKSIQKLSK